MNNFWCLGLATRSARASKRKGLSGSTVGGVHLLNLVKEVGVIAVILHVRYLIAVR
jgi:hypothetical protein